MNSRDIDPGPLAEASCHTSGNQATLVLVRNIQYRRAVVWAALTDPTQLRQWAPFSADRNLATARSAVLRAADDIHAQDLPANVVAAIPPKRLEYTWGSDLLAWQLATLATGTQVTLHHTVENAEWLPSIAAGWHLCLAAADRLLDGRPIGPIIGQKSKPFGWKRLHDAYAATLGIPGTQWPDDLFPGA